MAEKRQTEFDAYKRLAGMRLTEDEQRSLLYALLNTTKPKVADDSRTQLDSVGQHVEGAKEFEANWGKMQGVSSGYRGIDRLTHGFCAGELVVLGGYTSRGKTQLAVNITHRVANSGTPVLFVTLEMTKPMLTSRFMRLGGVDPETAIFYQSAEVVEPADMDAIIARAKADGCGFVVIDHLHYFARGDNMLGRVGEVTRDFKRLAVKYELPILLLSQLRRPDRGGKKGKLAIPSLSDLKESGYIEQDADIVLMVHRDMPEDDPEANLSTDFTEVVVAQRKNRNRGMVGNPLIRLQHDQENGVLLSEPARFIGDQTTTQHGL